MHIMPLGPPNNYSLYIRFMHLGALTDYFNEGNFDWTEERQRDKAGRASSADIMLARITHIARSRDVDRNERTNERMNERVATPDYYA